MITQERFNAIYPEQLNKKQHSVLKLFLQGESEDEIAKARKLNDKSSVRYHISNICKLFGLENQEGEHYWQRPELIEIFAKYKPELLNPQLIDNGGDNNLILESPDDGPVGLNSAFYVVRGSTETDCYQQIEKSGALLRIKAPSKMGKTSLLIRILHHAEEQDYEIVRLNLRDIGVSILENKSDFLKWFFENICEQLDLDYQWIESLDFTESKCKLKFQVKILKEIQKPMVLILEELEQVFPYTETVTTFATLLRSWHEESKKMEIWKKLRMVLLYSTNIYVKLPDKQSPFNVGVPVDLTEFNSKAVQDLAVCHQLKLTENQ
ncbi:AAA-like domain-containing protein, partial [Planktothrix agardhii]|uniref:AAA-like domain-containing protein n=1 Tax=Planktothrix agardhii TaxID=1160 RepID=UPI0028A7D684